MSGMNINRDRTFIAGADLSNSQYCLVKLGSTQNQVVLSTSATDNTIGIILDGGKGAGDRVRVGLLTGQGTYYMKASAATAIGLYLTATTGGAVVSTTTTGNTVVGVNIDAASAVGDLLEVIPMKFKY